MSLTRYEQETIINFTEADSEASIYTHNRPLIRRLEQLAQERPEECRLVNTFPIRRAVEYYVPKSWLRINPTRILSEEQRAAMAENARKRFLGRNTQAIIGDGDTPAIIEGNYTAQPLDGEGDKQ